MTITIKDWEAIASQDRQVGGSERQCIQRRINCRLSQSLTLALPVSRGCEGHRSGDVSPSDFTPNAIPVFDTGGSGLQRIRSLRCFVIGTIAKLANQLVGIPLYTALALLPAHQPFEHFPLQRKRQIDKLARPGLHEAR
jgi:hypothetical protein